MIKDSCKNLPNLQRKVLTLKEGVVVDVDRGAFALNHQVSVGVQVDLEDLMRDPYLFQSCWQDFLKVKFDKKKGRISGSTVVFNVK